MTLRLSDATNAAYAKKPQLLEQSVGAGGDSQRSCVSLG